MKKINWKLLILCLVIVYAVAFFGSLFTFQVTNSSWYDSIRPSITPPNWVFPIVWNLLFLLIGLGLYFSLMYSKNKKQKKRIWIIYGINLLLNLFWSALYFGLKSPFFAFIEIFFLIISIVLMVVYSYGVKKSLIWFILPYLLWVSFASVLNYLSIFS